MSFQNIPKNLNKTAAFTQAIAHTAYGQDKSEKLTPVTQISAEYGLLGQVLTINDTSASGSNSVVDNKFTCQTGTSTSGLASITSLRQINHRAGQGSVAFLSGGEISYFILISDFIISLKALTRQEVCYFWDYYLCSPGV